MLVLETTFPFNPLILTMAPSPMSVPLILSKPPLKEVNNVLSIEYVPDLATFKNEVAVV